jgi:hypothetical protein
MKAFSVQMQNATLDLLTDGVPVDTSRYWTIRFGSVSPVCSKKLQQISPLCANPAPLSPRRSTTIVLRADNLQHFPQIHSIQIILVVKSCLVDVSDSTVARILC